jgi:hypothetical protein
MVETNNTVAGQTNQNDPKLFAALAAVAQALIEYS